VPEVQQKTVKIHRVQEDTVKILKEAVKNSRLNGKQKIYVKPNISHPEYLPGVVTCPKLISELVGLLRDDNKEVIVGESNGFNYPCRGAFENTGIEAAVKKAGGSVINLSEDKVVKVNFHNKHSPVKALFLPKTVIDADATVDMALMKTHEFAMYSGAIKNLFGCVPSNRRIYLHPYLSEVLYRLYMVIKPQLTVMDARVAIEGNGPTKGNPVKMDLMLTSNCALATDLIASKIMGLKMAEISYLNYIARKTNLNEDTITVQGLQVSEVARNFVRPRIDLPVKLQMLIYRHEFLTKSLFCSLGFVQLLQKVTVAYRGRPVELS
jgi:uncharacterized protein (DUF362 family)